MVWTKSEKQLKELIGELNQKHPSIKFVYKFDYKQIEFLDTLVYIDKQNKLQTTLFRKSSDRQRFLNAKLEHPYSLKKGIPYTQTLPIRWICSILQEYHSHSRKLIEQFVNKGYKKDVVWRLTNSIENSCCIIKKAMINNTSLCHIVERYQI